MNKGETAKLLVMVSALDRQPVDDGMVEMWHRMLGEFSFADCEAALIPAYKESRNGFITAKAVWDSVRREFQYPSARQWVEDLHNIGEHFECKPGEFGCR
jgi:gamma-glutamyltranspeptidase